MEKEEVVVEEANVVEEDVAEETPVEEAPVEAAPVEEKPAATEDTNGALMSFILALIGLTLCAIPYAGGIACIILGSIAKKKAGNAGVVTKQPFRTFQKIGRIAGIVEIPLGIILTIIWVIVGIIAIIGIIAAAIAGEVDETARLVATIASNF